VLTAPGAPLAAIPTIALADVPLAPFPATTVTRVNATPLLDAKNAATELSPGMTALAESNSKS
jgi:hypothetical protein